MKLNSSKCSVFRAGALKNRNATYCPKKNFLWCSDKAKTLVFNNTTCSSNVKHDYNHTFKLNLQQRIDAFCYCLKQWQHRKLSLIGKITVIKYFAFPKLIYPLSVLQHPPDKYIKEIKKAMFEFLWNKKPDKIKRNLISKNYEDGGLKMLDIDKFLIA